MSGYCYIASPYAGYFNANLATAHDAACRFAARLIDAGWPCFSPIAHTHHIADHIRVAPKHDSAWWVGFDRPLLDAAGALVAAEMPGWRVSKGVSEEVRITKAAGKLAVSIPVDREVPLWPAGELTVEDKVRMLLAAGSGQDGPRSAKGEVAQRRRSCESRRE